MSDVEDPMPREQARTPFEGGGARDDPMVSGGLLDATDEGEPGVRFTAPPTPGAPVGSWDPSTPSPSQTAADEGEDEASS